MINFLAKILGYIMYGCYWLVDNYVVALLLFALVMQLLMSPLGIKQQKNMVKQAMLRPKEMAIRKKYAGRTDKLTMQKMQNEILELQRAEGYSPLAGCLPMLVQLIIIFPLYQVVIRPLEFISHLSSDVCAKLVECLGVENSTTAQIAVASKLNAGGNGQIPPDLVVGEGESAINVLEAVEGTIIPNVSMFGTDLGGTPFDAFGERYWWLILIPILNLGFMYLSQYLTKKLQYQSTIQEDAQGAMSSMKIMMLVMPLMTMFITFKFAAAIGIYWIFRTILSMAQQYILYKAIPYPKFTEQDYKDAELEMKGKKSKIPAGYVEGQREIRSLHHIDDDE